MSKQYQIKYNLSFTHAMANCKSKVYQSLRNTAYHMHIMYKFTYYISSPNKIWHWCNSLCNYNILNRQKFPQFEYDIAILVFQRILTHWFSDIYICRKNTFYRALCYVELCFFCQPIINLVTFKYAWHKRFYKYVPCHRVCCVHVTYIDVMNIILTVSMSML